MFFRELSKRSTSSWVKNTLAGILKGKFLGEMVVGIIFDRGWLMMEDRYDENSWADSEGEVEEIPLKLADEGIGGFYYRPIINSKYNIMN